MRRGRDQIRCDRDLQLEEGGSLAAWNRARRTGSGDRTNRGARGKVSLPQVPTRRGAGLHSVTRIQVSHGGRYHRPGASECPPTISHHHRQPRAPRAPPLGPLPHSPPVDPRASPDAAGSGACGRPRGRRARLLGGSSVRQRLPSGALSIWRSVSRGLRDSAGSGSFRPRSLRCNQSAPVPLRRKPAPRSCSCAAPRSPPSTLARVSDVSANCSCGSSCLADEGAH